VAARCSYTCLDRWHVLALPPDIDMQHIRLRWSMTEIAARRHREAMRIA